jgi:hypothetical protein
MALSSVNGGKLGERSCGLSLSYVAMMRRDNHLGNQEMPFFHQVQRQIPL